MEDSWGVRPKRHDMRIFFVRHGQSELNDTGIHQRRDTRLSARGREQASKLVERFGGVSVDVILASTYPRAVETARIIGRRLGRRVVSTKLLDEWRISSEVEGRNFTDRLAARQYKEHLANIDDPKWHYSDEENVFDLNRRVRRMVKYLGNRKENSVIAVTHAGVINMAVAQAVFGPGITGSDFIRFREVFHCDNTGITEVELDGGMLKVLTFNDYAHLKDIE